MSDIALMYGLESLVLAALATVTAYSIILLMVETSDGRAYGLWTVGCAAVGSCLATMTAVAGIALRRADIAVRDL